MCVYLDEVPQMYVIENRATSNQSPPLFWEVSAVQPTDPDGRPVMLGRLESHGGYARRVIGRAQSLDSLMGLLTNQDMGRIDPRAAERAWRAAQNQGPREVRRVEPITEAAPVARSQRARSFGSDVSLMRRRVPAGGPVAASTMDTSSLLLALLFIAAVAAVIIWIAMI